MRFHGDLTQATPVYKDLHVYDSSDTGIIAGQAMGVNPIATAEGSGGIIDVNSALIDFVGVTAEAPSALSVIATGAEKFCKTIVNPCAFYLAEYDDTNEGTVTAASSSGELITDTGIDADQEGGWAYITGPSGNTGEGNLIKIGNTDTTIKLTNVTGTAYDDELGASTTSSTYIIIRKTFQGAPTGGGIDLDSTFAKVDGSIDSTGAAISLANFIHHKRFPMEHLRTTKHAGRKVVGANFYASLYFCDATLRGASTLA